jgi:hypothetical protein
MRTGFWLRLAVAVLMLFEVAKGPISGAENVACLSDDPADWPQPSKPYAMIVADTSGSMVTCTNPATAYPNSCPITAVPNSCGLVPTRYNDLKCAIDRTTKAFAGQVSFGLATFATTFGSCPASCSATCPPADDCFSESYGCTVSCFQDEVSTTGSCQGCGPRSGDATTRSGAFIRVPVPQDHFWSVPPEPSNVQELLAWVDTSCAGDRELYASGSTPLNGVLRDMKRYFESGWSSPDGGAISYPSPLDASDLPGDGVNGGTACRDLHVILITDGDETCDTQSDAVSAAHDLYENGVTVGGKTFKIRTHVVNFGGGSQANADAIAAAGGTGSALLVFNEVGLSQALVGILTGADAETCDNLDNNCNGCTDEGFTHYANTGQTCCSWSTPAEREVCLDNYESSVSTSPPDGDTTFLPCTTTGQQAEPATWLCYDPGDICDAVDNNGVDGIDEGQVRCGSPLHCPSTETCNGEDDDCDGLLDEGNVCGGCIPSPEMSDGCDNDCNGIADDGTFDAISCGEATPVNCVGTRSCAPPQVVPVGGCAPEGGWDTCSNAPEAETCDGADNDCNGIADDGLSPVPCEPAGTAGGLVYGGTSQCVKGQQYCGEACVGFVGPTPEVSDGIDNDCNGVVDDFVLGAIVVEKTALPANSGETFSFTGAVAGNLAAGGVLAAGGLAPGTHVVSEEVPTGWTLKGIECDDGNSTVDLPSARADYEVEVGETVTCVFTNCIADLEISPQSVSTSEIFSACNSVSAGAGFTVEASGAVTFRTGRRIVLRDGFSVLAGGELTVDLEPALALPEQ